MGTTSLIRDEKIMEAFDGAFDKPIDFDHKPTVDEIFIIRLRAVAQAQAEELKRESEQALSDYHDRKISFERLAERMNLNFYALHTACGEASGRIEGYG